jgi:hypothetical protein
VPSPTPGANAQGGKRNAQPVTDASPLAFAEPGLTGQVAGLIALAAAVLLTVTRLSLRKRFRSRKQGSLARAGQTGRRAGAVPPVRPGQREGAAS